MIAVGANPRDSQLDSFITDSPILPLGCELPSLGCDLSDLNISSNEIDQILQGFGDASFPLDVHMHFGSDNFASPQSPCNFNSLFLEDTPRPRDLNISFPGETFVSPPFNVATSPLAIASRVSSAHTGHSTPQNVSRSTSPAWSESSGSISTSSTIMTSVPDRRPSRSNNPVPRHKRPSHKRAEVKRRGKIKTNLDDLKEFVPSLRDKGKLSESTILSKAAENIQQLKDGCTDQGSKAAELRREIETLSRDIHSFQEKLPAGGIKEDVSASPSLDDLFQQWASDGSQSKKFYIFTSLTSKLFETFKQVVSSATSLDSLAAKAQEWQAKCLGLPVLRKEILSGMLQLSRNTSILTDSESLNLKMDDSTS